MLFRISLVIATVFSAVHFVAGQPFAEDDEITIAQVLDLNSWMDDDIEIPSTMIGEWKSSTFGHISVTASPIASNTCFVQVSGRMVPGFFVSVDNAAYFVIGLNASEELHLIPEVFSYSLSDENNEVVLTRVQFPITPVDFENFAAFAQCLKKESEHLEVSSERFVRI